MIVLFSYIYILYTITVIFYSYLVGESNFENVELVGNLKNYIKGEYKTGPVVTDTNISVTYTDMRF